MVPGRRNGSSAGWRPTGPADAPAPPDADGYQLRGLLHGHRMHCHKPARWCWVFDELEAEFEDGLHREAQQETMAPVGPRLAPLWLARRFGTEMVASAGHGSSGIAPSRAIRSSSSWTVPTAPST